MSGCWGGVGRRIAQTAAQLHQAGAAIRRSVNGALLTAGFAGNIPPQYVIRVERVRDREVLWPVMWMLRGCLRAIAAERRQAIGGAKALVAAAALENDPAWPLEGA